MPATSRTLARSRTVSESFSYVSITRAPAAGSLGNQSWEAVPSTRAACSTAVLEFRQLLELVLRRARQLDFAAFIVDHQAVIGHRHEMPPDAEETTDLEHGEQGTVARNDKVVDGADLLVLLVGDATAHELRHAITLRDCIHVDG